MCNWFKCKCKNKESEKMTMHGDFMNELKINELKEEILSLKVSMIQRDECLSNRIEMLNKSLHAHKEIVYDKLKPTDHVGESKIRLENIFKFIEKYGYNGVIKMQNPYATKIYNSDGVLLATAEPNSMFTITTVSFLGRSNWNISQNGRNI